MRKIYLQTCLTSILCSLTAAAGWGADAPTEAGAKIYAAKCAACHAKDLKGNPAMAKMFALEAGKLSLISKEAAAKSDKDLIDVTTHGKGKMPAQKGKLTPEEIANVIAYVRSLTPKASDGAGK